MLHVTNGDSAVERIRAAGVEGPILPWRDVLYDGPVPAGLPLDQLSAVRADFIASRGWGSADEARRGFAERDRILASASAEDEVVLWFEHDLYDQLQLIQVLDWFADPPHPRLTLALAGPPQYLGLMGPSAIRELFDARIPATPAHLRVAREAWQAFRDPDPHRVEERAHHRDTPPLPWLPAALLRLLEEYPSVDDGLSRSERQALRAFLKEPRRLVDAYRASHHGAEDAIWMGDSSWLAMVEALAAEPSPLLAYADDADDANGGMARRMEITDAGRRVLAGEVDAVRTRGIDRWIGGVHLSGREPPWRWDPMRSRLVPR